MIKSKIGILIALVGFLVYLILGTGLHGDDLATIAQKEFPRRNHILNILCSDDMMIKIPDNYSRKTVIKNVIHDMIQNELGLNNTYLA